jgi:hypothetical protein
LRTLAFPRSCGEPPTWPPDFACTASKAETGSIIRAAFAQQKVVCYVLIVAASSEGKQYVLFTPEDEFGLMVGH